MWFSLVFTFNALSVGASLPVADTRAARHAERERLARAGDYLALLFGSDLESAGRLMAEDILFEDPTAAVLNGVGVRIRGRADVLAAFERARGQPEVVSGVVRSSFAVGTRVVAQVALRARVAAQATARGRGGAETRGKAGGERGFVVASGTTILEFSDSGLVTRQLDLADYRRLLDGLAVAGDIA